MSKLLALEDLTPAYLPASFCLSSCYINYSLFLRCAFLFQGSESLQSSSLCQEYLFLFCLFGELLSFKTHLLKLSLNYQVSSHPWLTKTFRTSPFGAPTMLLLELWAQEPKFLQSPNALSTFWTSAYMGPFPWNLFTSMNSFELLGFFWEAFPRPT